MLTLIILSLSVVFSVIINWIMIRFSFNLGVRNVNKEDEIRWQQRKPSVGGISFYLVFLIMFGILTNLTYMITSDKLSVNSDEVFSLFIIATLGFFVGLIDDAKNTNPLLKFMGQILCGLVLVYFNIIIPISPNIVWNSILTIMWTVFLMNSINMLDNMDGMTSTVSFLIFIGIYSLARGPITSLTQLLVLVCGGAIFGFLIYNWNPSRIYMGDSGSQFLGTVLAHFSVLFLWGNRMENGGYFQLTQFFVPMMVFTVPIFDTLTVSIHRLLRRQSPFVGGKDHLSHHLVFLGLSDYQSVFLLSTIHFVFTIIGIYVYYQCSHLMIPAVILWIIAFFVLQYFYIKANGLKPIDSK